MAHDWLRGPYLGRVFQVLLLADVQQTFLLDLVVQGFEAELGTSGCQGLDNSDDDQATKTHNASVSRE